MTNFSNNSPITIESFLEPLQTTENNLSEIVSEASNEDAPPVSHAQEDYEFARRQLRDLIVNGTSLLQDASSLASHGQQAEHYEVASAILGQVITANKELLGLSATHQKVTGALATKNSKVTNNNLFVGSTAELLKLMKNEK